MEFPEPFTVLYICLSSGYVSYVLGVDEADFQSRFLDDLINGYPVYAGGLHSDGVHATFEEPLSDVI